MKLNNDCEFNGIEPPSEIPLIKWINVHGREEHEALLKDDKKMVELGLDPYFEKIVYLRRWGGWLNETEPT